MIVFNKINELFNKLYTLSFRIQFLNGNCLKIIAMLIMLMDHFTKSFFIYNFNNICDVLNISTYMMYEKLKLIYWPIGSIAFPLFCFLLVEGFLHTKHLKKYFLLMFLFALISEIPFDYAFFIREMKAADTIPFYFEYQNVFFTLLLGLTTIWGISKIHEKFNVGLREKIISLLLNGTLIFTTSMFAEKLMCDYGAYGVLLITGFYLTRTNRIYQILFYVLLFLIFKHFLNFPQLIVSLLILLYNGKRGKHKIKYFGYIFYPAHLTLLYILSIIKFW